MIVLILKPLTECDIFGRIKSRNRIIFKNMINFFKPIKIECVRMMQDLWWLLVENHPSLKTYEGRFYYDIKNELRVC